MFRAIRVLSVALAPIGCGVIAQADSPADLAKRVEKALSTGNVDALVAEIDQLSASTGFEQFVLMDMASDCSQEMKCLVAARPFTAEEAAEMKKKLTEGTLEFAQQPEGALEMKAQQAGADGSTGSMGGILPYAKVGSSYKVAGARPTAAQLAKLKGTTAEAATEALLAKGVRGDEAWKSKAKALPADGGDAGQAFAASVKALGAAVKAKDSDAAAAARGSWGKRVLGPTDSSGKTRSPAERQLTLRTQAVRLIVDARVLGGYLLDDTAVLTIEGANGAGNTIRGPLVLSRQDTHWEIADPFGLIEIPKGM